MTGDATDPIRHSARSPDGDYAFNNLVRRYRSPLLRFFERRVGNRADAEELAQEVFYRIARKPDVLALPAIEGYLFEVAANLLRDRARRLRARGGDDAVSVNDVEIESDAPSAEQSVEGKNRLHVLLKAMDQLSARRRTILLLSRYEQMTHSAIAEELGISVSLVEKEMIRALAQLREVMSEGPDDK